MDVELLHIDDCPSGIEAGLRVRAALDAIGLVETPVRYRLLRTPEDAVNVAFAGSPTILVDGADLFPDAEPTDNLSCRIYWTPAGVKGLPTTDQMIEAMRSHGR